MTVGLLGGSFDPPHLGHVHITREALKRFGLDCVVWLVSPGNPLKKRGPAPLEKRMKAARRLVNHPRVLISDIEQQIGTRYTAETLAILRLRHPGVRFVWLMGADNLAHFHKWDSWQDILGSVPVGVLARPGDRISARLSKAARMYRHDKLSGRSARILAVSAPPVWCFVTIPMSHQSSTALRASGTWI